MGEGVKALGYGNQTIGDQVDRFWLDGPLEISAVEQTFFLARLVNGTLPVNAAALAAVKEITLREHEASFDLHYKTGWATTTKPQIGWIVGWVTAKEGFYPFALNIDMADLKDAPKRLRIAKGCLKALGKLP
jgi:beta-lactamase class D